MVNIRIDPRMQQALRKLADSQFSSMASIIKKAIDKYLQDQDIDWRKEPEKKVPPKKGKS